MAQMNRTLTVIENTEAAMDKYGHAYGSEHVLLIPEHIKALQKGYMLAMTDGEYVTFMSMEIPLPKGYENNVSG